MSEAEDRSRALTDALLDLLVYAPIGLTLDSQELAPELAKRGRQHVAAARQIGEMAVKSGMRRLDDLIGAGGDDDRGPAPADEAPEEGAAAGSGSEADRPSSEHLAIPDYDLLAASQVVKRLDALDGDELEAVRAYEAATRDRRTILHKIARLQA